MTSFNFSYFISLFLALSSIYVLHIKNKDLQPILLYFIIPITVAYLSLIILDVFFDSTDEVSDSVLDYIQHQYYESIRTTGYYTVFPPFIVFILIFMVLLYYQNF